MALDMAMSVQNSVFCHLTSGSLVGSQPHYVRACCYHLRWNIVRHYCVRIYLTTV